MLTFAGSANTLAITGVGSFAYKFLMEQYNLDYMVAGYLLGWFITLYNLILHLFWKYFPNLNY